jgi:hypothetical protein
MTFQQATIELAVLAGPRTRSIDMEYNHFHREVGDDRTELTWTVSIMDDQHKWQQWHGATLDEAMTAARYGLESIGGVSGARSAAGRGRFDSISRAACDTSRTALRPAPT